MNDISTASDLKRQIREEAIRRRDGIPFAVKKVKDSFIRERLFALPEFKEADRVLLYASFRSEVGTEIMIEETIGLGKKVLIPKVNSEEQCLTKHIINGLHEVSPGYMGIPEPDTDHCLKVEEIHFLVIPGVAFDPAGWRIGYGGGYYDKLLPRIKGIRTIVALSYEEQMFDALPHEDHDVAMDLIITDKRIIDCRGQGKD